MQIKVFNLIAAGALMALGCAQRNIYIVVSGAALLICANYNIHIK